MTRIIAGAARGRRLVVPVGQGTRPLADRAREGLFASLISLRGTMAAARFLDGFAGSGGVGLEALSRGATSVLLVEADPKAARIIRDNIVRIDLPGAEVVVSKVERLIAQPCPADPFDVVFLGPPYAMPNEVVRHTVALLAAGGWIQHDAFIVVERSSRGQVWNWPRGCHPIQTRRYGDGTLWYARYETL